MRSAHRMARCLHSVMGLLLFSFIRTGINGEYSLIPTGRSYDIRVPDDKGACYYLWHFGTPEERDFIAIVTNGEMQSSPVNDSDSNWALRMKTLQDDDVGNQRCHQSAGDSKVILVSGNLSTLQCVLLTNTQQEHCRTQLQQKISLMWTDEVGAWIREDSQHQIQQQSSCDVTLVLQSPVRKKLRCQVTVDDQAQTSVDVWVRVTGRGRGIILKPEPGHQGHGRDLVGAAVGVVGCAVLTALIAAFAVKRKRANRQLTDESCNTVSSYHVAHTDDVVYADIVLPAGSDIVWVQECEATEYACIRYE